MANFSLIGWVYSVHALFFGIGFFCCPSSFITFLNSLLKVIKLTPVVSAVSEHTHCLGLVSIAIGLMFLQATLFRHSQVLENGGRAKIVVFLLCCYLFFVTKAVGSGVLFLFSSDLILGLWMLLSVSSAKSKSP